MRILAILLTETRQQVAYRWTETPFEPPRLLVDEARTSAAVLRAQLETILGEPLRANEYRLVTRAVDQQVIQAAFSDLEMTSDAPDDADIFVLADWRFESPDFDALCNYLEVTLIEPLNDFEQVRRDFQAVRDSIRVVIAGRSVRALMDVYQQITGETISLPRTPSKQAMIERRFGGIPITILDLRSGVVPDVPANVLLIIAAASDPGIGQEELALIENGNNAVVAVVNTHDDERHFAAMIAYIQKEVGAIPVMANVEQIGLSVRAALEKTIKTQLINRIESLPESDERSRAHKFIEKFTL